MNKTFKRWICMILAVLCLVSCLSACAKDDGKKDDKKEDDVEDAVSSDKEEGEETLPTAEKQIKTRIATFVSSYNNGDVDGFIACLDAKSRNTMNAMLNLMGGVLGGVTGFGIDLRDLFTLGIALAPEDLMKISVQNIRLVDENNAVVTAQFMLSEGNDMLYFIMVREADGWFIHDMTEDEPNAGGNEEGSDSTTASAITVTTRNEFFDGRTVIQFERDDLPCWGVIDTEGNLLYEEKGYVTGEGSWSYEISTLVRWEPIGKGCIYAHTRSKDGEELDILINSEGTVTVTSRLLNDAEFTTFGFGMAVVYKREASISAVDHYYGVIDVESGNWLIPLEKKDQEYEVRPVGDGFVEYYAEQYGEYPRVYLLKNPTTNVEIKLSNVDFPGEFADGKRYGYWNQGYYWEDNTGYIMVGEDAVQLPEFFVLNSDGTYAEVNGITDKYQYWDYGKELIYEEEYVRIHNVITDTSYYFDDYAASMVTDVEFGMTYDLVYLRGVDDKDYFTVVDQEGTMLFEPISYNSYVNAQWNENVIIYGVYGNNGNACCVVDLQGNVVVSAEKEIYNISSFNSGIAIAYKAGEHFYINTKGEEVLTEIK